MTTIKKGDFVRIDYTAKVNMTNQVFDTTDEATAKATGIYQEHAKIEPAIIIVGAGYVIPGLDEQLEGKKTGESFSASIGPDKAFGKKNPELLKLVPLRKFKEQNIQPFVGLEVNIDNQRGFVRSVSGGRVIVDFNSPLQGQDVTYDVKILDIVDNPETQVSSIVRAKLQVPDIKVEVKDKKATVEFPMELPKEITDRVNEDITKYAKVKDVEWKVVEPKTDNKPATA